LKKIAEKAKGVVKKGNFVGVAASTAVLGAVIIIIKTRKK